MAEKGKLIHTVNAPVTKRQHTSPCSDCPFLRDAVPGWLGMTPPEKWEDMAQSFDGHAVCHALKKENGNRWDCVGLAIYRANIGRTARPYELQAEPNTDLVFSEGEFVEHHRKGELS
jgi:hypothetical protein